MVPFGWQVVVNAVGLWIVDGLWSSMWVEPAGQSVLTLVVVYLVLGFLLAVVNSVVKPLLKAISFPLYILTLGLFALVVNAAVLELVSWVTSFASFGLRIGSFWTAVWAGLVLAITTALLSIPLKRRSDDDGSR
ncbi:MAG: phage holin family protein [Bifidobacteriaceae bacterium]|jgi:putative membrane protein|nr:phage holin family protein [Bifidobacteriaceae bacterium]